MAEQPLRRFARRIGDNLWLSIVGVVLVILGVGMALLLLVSSIQSTGVEGRPQRRRLRRRPTASPERAATPGEVWARSAIHEASSVGAFEVLARQLARAGAPDEIIARSVRAAADERRHAQVCRSIARDLGSPLPEGDPHPRPALEPVVSTHGRHPRRQSILRLQVGLESMLDGVLDEGFSARLLERGAHTAVDPRLRSRLRSLAADEAEHAALAQAIVDWCVAEVGLPARLALRCARVRRHLPRRHPGMPRLPDEELEAAGLVPPSVMRGLWDAHVRAA